MRMVLKKQAFKRKTLSLFPSQNNDEKKVFFSQNLFEISDIKNWLLCVKENLPKKFKLGEVILFYESKQFGLRRAYIKNGSHYDETVQTLWNTPPSVSYNPAEMQKYLAEEMGRPFSQVLCVPFPELKKISFDSYHTPLLFVELLKSQKSNQDFLNFFIEKKEILKMVLKRVLINAKMSHTSILWNSIFEDWKEGLALLKDNRILRSNECFNQLLSLCPKIKLYRKKHLLQINNQIYQIHYYPIPLEEKETSFSQTGIMYCQNLTNYFQLKEKALQSEKMTLVSNLGKNLAHELNNPLTGILSMTQILQKNEDHKNFNQDLKEVEKSVVRTQKIITSFLTFSRNQKTEKELCNLNQVIEDTLPLLKTLSQKIKIHLSLEKEPLPFILGNFSLLQQVIFNLITNACQAVIHSKTSSPLIEIKTKVKNNKVLILVTDNGHGISKEHQEKIFQPLWTTKKSGEGTGLGLGITKQFVHNFGGQIEVKSKPHKETTFTLAFPFKNKK